MYVPYGDFSGISIFIFCFISGKYLIYPQYNIIYNLFILPKRKNTACLNYSALF